MSTAMHRTVAAVGLFALVAGCSATNPSTPESNHAATVAGTIEYLHTGATRVIYLQWLTAPSGPSTGTVKDEYLTGTAPNEVVTDNTDRFTVQTTASGALAFDFSKLGASVYGTQANQTLTLNLPQQSGELVATAFRRATPQAYDEALASLRDAARRTNSIAVQQQTITSDENAISQAVQAVNNDLDALRQLADSTNGLVPCGSDTNVSDYVPSASNTVEGLASDLTTLRADITKLTNDADNQSSTPVNVQQSIANGGQTVNQAIPTANEDIDQINSHVISGAKSGLCTTGVTSLEPIPHLD